MKIQNIQSLGALCLSLCVPLYGNKGFIVELCLSLFLLLLG